MDDQADGARLTAADLGLPADREPWLELPEAGPHLPGASLQLRGGIAHGVAAPHRRLVYELRGPDGVVGHEERSLTVIGPRNPIDLELTLPETAGVAYELTLAVDGTVFRWPVNVPEQRVDARLECAPAIVRRGQLLHAAIHNGAVVLSCGADYWIERWDGEAWTLVDPFDGEAGAWAAIGYMIDANATWPLSFEVPERTDPGRHRVSKRVDAGGAGVGDVALTAEFTVCDGPPVDYAELIRTGAWRGVRPGAGRDHVRAALGEPDTRSDPDRVWRYGDLELHFAGDALAAYFGRTLPWHVLHPLLDSDAPANWTLRLDSGAELHLQRAQRGVDHRLLWFCITQ